MGIRELGRALGISPSLVSRLVKRGMPTSSAQEAIAWRLQYVRHRPPAKPKVIEVNFENPPPPAEREDLGASLERLRALERSTAIAIQGLLAKGRTSEAIALRAQHGSMIRQLFDAEAKAVKLALHRGELVTTKKAEAMIVSALAEPVMMLRQLPSLARDPAQQETLTAFMNGCLEALKEGARTGLERSALSREASV